MRFLAFLLFLLGLCSGRLDAQESLSDGIIAYYPFDGDVKDYSGNCLNGINYGSDFVNDRFGNVKSAVEFNGFSDYIEIEHSELFNFDRSEDFAISFWVKIPAAQLDIDTTDNDIISKWVENDDAFNHFNTGYPYTVRIHNQKREKLKNRLYAAQFSGYMRGCNNAVDLQSRKSLSSDKFTHMLVNVLDGQCSIYQDGKMMRTKKQTITCSSKNEAPLRFGKRGGPLHSNYFTGVLDELIIYGRGLTKKEINFLSTGTYEINEAQSFKTDFSSVIIKDTIYFEDNIFELSLDQRNALLSIAKYLDEGQMYHLMIEGHTNNIPDSAFCDELSLKRAQVIENYLFKKGVDCHKVTTRGKGKRYPIATNETVTGRKKNQRAEVFLYKLKEP